MYKIVNEAELRATYPQFIKMKKVRTVTEVATLNQRAVKQAVKLGIAIPGVEEAE